MFKPNSTFTVWAECCMLQVMLKYITLHNHFYQPPRENPWTGEIEVEVSAAPFHNWNERITVECYKPFAFVPIRDARRYNTVEAIMNNYEWTSFNFGPTLLAWMELHEPWLYERILEADRLSVEHFGGHGNAIAQAYNHMLLPLANTRDKETQITWGLADFEYRFGRKAEAMWLPEAASDMETLQLLAKHGMKYVLLPSSQAAVAVDVRQPYMIEGLDLAVFFFDSDFNSGKSYGEMLQHGDAFFEDLAGRFSEDDTLVHFATDGEIFGHHHAEAEVALAYMLRKVLAADEYELTNYGAYLEAHPPTQSVQLREESQSWSCVHGIDRWKKDCACMDVDIAHSQEWRAPLREALDWLGDEVAQIYGKEMVELGCSKPWEARNNYIQVVLGAKTQEEFAQELGVDDAAIALLEMQQFAMLMYTSCGWFFDDISGRETQQILQYAARVLEHRATEHLQTPFIEKLEKAKSNTPGVTGADTFTRVIQR